MKRTIASLLFLIGLSFAVTASADVVEYFNDFSVGKVAPGSQAKWSQTTDLRPWYSNLRYYKTGGDDNIRFNLGTGYMKQASGTGSGTIQMEASRFLSTATAYDLTAGDLVYECWYACDWHGNTTNPGSFHHGISINDNQMLFIYHPGYSSGSMLGAFRVEGKIGNQSIGFVPPIDSDSNFTMMKLTIHRDEAAGNYVFTTQFGLANSGDHPGEYTFSHTYTCPLATFDDVGGIKSIGPYNYKQNNAVLTNLRLEAPFSDAEFAKAENYSSSLDYVVYTDKPVHWYKFDDRSTNIIADYGSNPVEGAGASRNVDMSAISDLRQVADFSGNNSKVDLTGTTNLTGDWTAEFVINPHNITGRQALVSGDNGSLRWIMNNGKPGFTKWGAYDAEFKAPDGVSAFSYDLSQILDEWIHVAYVRQGNDLFLYINGELVGKNASNQPAIDLPISRTIGSNGDGEAFAGIVDDMAFYSYAMSEEQIMNHAFPETVTAKYYNVRSTDISAENWTVDGTNKKGVVFVEGKQDTAAYDNPVTLDVDGTFETSVGKNLILSGGVSGSGVLEKIGAGKLTLSGDNTYSGVTSVKAGTLTLTGDGIKANSAIEIASGATLEYNVPEGEQQLTFSDGATVSGGNVLKTGAGKLKILASDNQFQSDLFTVETGELDFKGQYIGKLEINKDGVFSPGNSVGHVDIDGNFTLNGGTLLIEMDASGVDTMTANSFDLDNGTISFLLDDIPWGSSYDILTATGDSFDEGIIAQILGDNTLPYYYSLALAGDGSIVRMSIDRNAVPEPSTWALMILGAAGLLYWRKRK